MKLQYVFGLDDLREALASGVELCVACYFVPLTIWHMCQPGWTCDAGVLQQQRAGEHTILCVPKNRLDIGLQVLESESRRWAPLDPETIFWDKRELGPCTEEFGFYCLEAHMRLFSAVEALANILRPELVIVGKVAGQRSEYVARNPYHWAQLFQVHQGNGMKGT